MFCRMVLGLDCGACSPWYPCLCVLVPMKSFGCSSAVLRYLRSGPVTSGENLAAHGVATQSSQAGAGSAHLALTSGHGAASRLSLMGSAASVVGGLRAKDGTVQLHSRTKAEKEPWWDVDLRHITDVSVIEFSFGPVQPRTDLWVMAGEHHIGRRGNQLSNAKQAAGVAIRVPVEQLHAQPVTVAVRTCVVPGAERS